MRYVIISLGILFIIFWPLYSIFDIIKSIKKGYEMEFLTDMWISIVIVVIIAISFMYW